MSLALEQRTIGHASYINMENVLQKIKETDSSDLTANGIQMIERLNGTFTFLKEAIDRVDPWLVSISSLNSINNPITSVLNEITNFKSNRNEQHLINALTYVENILPFFPQFLVTQTPEEIEGVRSAVIKFRQSVGQHLSHVERESTDTTIALTKNTEKLEDLTTLIESQKGRIDSIITDFQKQFLDNQTQRTEDFNTFKTLAEKDFNVSMKSYEEAIEQFLTTQQKSYDSLNEKFEQQMNNQQTYFDTLVEELKTQMKTELEQINSMNKEAEKIVGIISMKGLAHGYQKIANDEGKKALWWNIGSLISISLLIGFGYQYIIKHEGVMTWTDLVSRLILTGIGITLFTYCAKQATNHRLEERRNRKIELELASLDPYLKDLEPEEQKVVKQNLVEKYFGVELPATLQQQQHAVDKFGSNPQLMQLLADKVSQLMTK